MSFIIEDNGNRTFGKYASSLPEFSKRSTSGESRLYDSFTVCYSWHGKNLYNLEIDSFIADKLEKSLVKGGLEFLQRKRFGLLSHNTELVVFNGKQSPGGLNLNEDNYKISVKDNGKVTVGASGKESNLKELFSIIESTLVEISPEIEKFWLNF
jgi:hypothetical protein